MVGQGALAGLPRRRLAEEGLDPREPAVDLVVVQQPLERRRGHTQNDDHRQNGGAPGRDGPESRGLSRVSQRLAHEPGGDERERHAAGREVVPVAEHALARMNEEQGAEEGDEERQQHRPRAAREALGEERAKDRHGHGERREHQDQVHEVGRAGPREYRPDHSARGSDVRRCQMGRQVDSDEGRDEAGQHTAEGDERKCQARDGGRPPPSGGAGEVPEPERPGGDHGGDEGKRRAVQGESERHRRAEEKERFPFQREPEPEHRYRDGEHAHLAERLAVAGEEAEVSAEKHDRRRGRGGGAAQPERAREGERQHGGERRFSGTQHSLDQRGVGGVDGGGQVVVEQEIQRQRLREQEVGGDVSHRRTHPHHEVADEPGRVGHEPDQQGGRHCRGRQGKPGRLADRIAGPLERRCEQAREGRNEGKRRQRPE